MKVIVLMGSPSDQAFVERITRALESLELPFVTHVASAHKTPQHALDLLKRYEDEGGPRVYITVAGRSNALSGFVDAQVTAPVIACPPYSESFGGADIWSSLRMPTGVAPAVILEPENAALLAAKILGMEDKIGAMQAAARHRLMEADQNRG